MEDNTNNPVISCPHSVIDQMYDNADATFVTAVSNLRHSATKIEIEEWGNFYGPTILLGEVYVASLNLKHLLTTLRANPEHVYNEKQEECIALTAQDLIMINACLNTLDLCQQELINAHNISLELH